MHIHVLECIRILSALKTLPTCEEPGSTMEPVCTSTNSIPNFHVIIFWWCIYIYQVSLLTTLPGVHFLVMVSMVFGHIGPWLILLGFPFEASLSNWYGWKNLVGLFCLLPLQHCQCTQNTNASILVDV